MFVPITADRYNIPEPKPGTVRKFTCWGEWDHYFDLIPDTVREMTPQEIKKANRFWRRKKRFIEVKTVNGTTDYWWKAKFLDNVDKKKLNISASEDLENRVVLAYLARIQHDI